MSATLPKFPREAPGSIWADPRLFPPPDQDNAWAINQALDWTDWNSPITFPGCFPWLPKGYNIIAEGAGMIPDRAGLCKSNREHHARKGITRSLAEFFPGQTMDAMNGRVVILCGSGPSLGMNLNALAKARQEGAAVVVVNGALKMVPDADVFFALERCSKPEWWANVNPWKVPIWTSPSAWYSIADHWPTDRRFYFLHHWDVFDKWPDRPPIIDRLIQTHSCMVSSINAVQLVSFCGPKEIWLLGQDFSGIIWFDPRTKQAVGGAYYADGTFPKELSGELGVIVPSVGGGNCGSTARLQSMGQAFKRACELITVNADIPVYNCGRFGIIDLPEAPEWKRYAGAKAA